ncbi:hypothetical protein HZA57_02700, partial [Candidatus Poribacteria bacterium]|nr:hypothetical protein [Candidatus Poribacteria bacterium]
IMLNGIFYAAFFNRGIAYSEKRFADCLIWLPVKFLALGLFLGGLIVMEGVPISSFLCGFGMFLIVCAAEAAGSLLTGAWRKPAGAPQALATILSGNRTDA